MNDSNHSTSALSSKSFNWKSGMKILLHMLMWVIFFSLPLLFRPRYSFGQEANMLHRLPLPILLNNLFLIIAFYTNLFILMPRFFNKKKWWVYVVISCLFLVGSIFLHTAAIRLEHWLGWNPFPGNGRPPRPRGGFEFRQFSFIYTFLMIWSISMVYYLINQLQASRRHAEQVKANALQSELSFLKAQINPHFLFNTLNNIYALSLKKSDKAPVAIMKLSNLMRQLTNDTGVDLVPFPEEEAFIRDYIELQQMRLTDTTHVIYQVTGSYDHLYIAPRLLIPFIDNAFKYGVSNRHPSDILISLDFTDSILHFKTKNQVQPKLAEPLEKTSGIGLENVKRRLDLLYKNKYHLTLSSHHDIFVVELELDLSV
jgi:hypothetical protein